jgi:hypothetical protein
VEGWGTLAHGWSGRIFWGSKRLMPSCRPPTEEGVDLRKRKGLKADRGKRDGETLRSRGAWPVHFRDPHGRALRFRSGIAAPPPRARLF